MQLTLEGEGLRNLRVSLPVDKTQKVVESLREINSASGMIPIRTLEKITGLLAWIANIIPVARPWTAMLWAALHAAKLGSAAGPKKMGDQGEKRAGI